MCWTSNTLKKRIVENTVTCYKICTPTSTARRYKSLVQKYIYDIGKISPKINDFPQVNPLDPDNDDDRSLLTYNIVEGYHSYAHLPSTKGLDSECIIIKCLIPKDAVYYYSKEHDEYVSDKIMFFEEVENPNSLKAKLMRLFKKPIK